MGGLSPLIAHKSPNEISCKCNQIKKRDLLIESESANYSTLHSSGLLNWLRISSSTWYMASTNCLVVLEILTCYIWSLVSGLGEQWVVFGSFTKKVLAPELKFFMSGTLWCKVLHETAVQILHPHPEVVVISNAVTKSLTPSVKPEVASIHSREVSQEWKCFTVVLLSILAAKNFSWQVLHHFNIGLPQPAKAA